MKKKNVFLCIALAVLFGFATAFVASAKNDITDGLMEADWWGTKIDCASQYEDSKTIKVLICSDCVSYVDGKGTKWSTCRQQ